MKVVLRAIPALVLAGAVAAPARAQDLTVERGNIVSTNWNAMELDIKDPKGRQATWKVRRDAVVVFSDKKEQFPNPKLTDLRAPMYVFFTYDNGTRAIEKFEVKEGCSSYCRGFFWIVPAARAASGHWPTGNQPK